MHKQQQTEIFHASFAAQTQARLKTHKRPGRSKIEALLRERSIKPERITTLGHGQRAKR